MITTQQAIFDAVAAQLTAAVNEIARLRAENAALKKQNVTATEPETK